MSRLVILSLVLSSLWCAQLVLAELIWIDGYPQCAREPLAAIEPSHCDHGNRTKKEIDMTNHCLCSDAVFLKAASKVIRGDCGCGQDSFSAFVMQSNCDHYGTRSGISLRQFVAAGGCTIDGKALPSASSNSLKSDGIAFRVGVVMGVTTLLLGVLGTRL